MTQDVRIATAADAAELSRVGMQSFNKAYRGTADDADIDAHLDAYFSESAIRGQMKLQSVRYFLASHGTSVTGFVKLRNREVPPPLSNDSAVEVQQLYVASEHQRAGVGQRLMDAAVADARRQRADSVWLSVWIDADWAISFYRRYGFEIAGELSFQLGRSEFRDYLMLYRLG